MCGENEYPRQCCLISLSVHPHVCGENVRHVSVLCCVSSGSPPRVWGKPPTSRPRGGLSSGSPPRVWGKPTDAFKYPPLVAVHPHVCGENWHMLSRGKPVSIGSPPRVWGKRILFILTSRDVVRFTPTCVGKTKLSVNEKSEEQRFTPTCVGKTNHLRHPLPPPPGSPPRVWGKQPLVIINPVNPAVHSHVCGENAESITSFS